MTQSAQRRGWRVLAQCVSLLALAGTIAPAVLFLTGQMDLVQVHSTMLVATAAWFVSAALWMEG